MLHNTYAALGIVHYAGRMQRHHTPAREPLGGGAAGSHAPRVREEISSKVQHVLRACRAVLVLTASSFRPVATHAHLPRDGHRHRNDGIAGHKRQPRHLAVHNIKDTLGVYTGTTVRARSAKGQTWCGM